MPNPSETMPGSKATSEVSSKSAAKKPYHAPAFTRLGTLKDLTLHNSSGKATDNPSGKSHTT